MTSTGSTAMEHGRADVVLVGCDSSDDGGKDDAATNAPRSGPGGSDELFIGADVDGHFGPVSAS